MFSYTKAVEIPHLFHTSRRATQGLSRDKVILALLIHIDLFAQSQNIEPQIEDDSHLRLTVWPVSYMSKVIQNHYPPPHPVFN